MAAHKSDKCLRCRSKNMEHGHGKDKNGNICTQFEFIAPSARHESDVLFTAHFPSTTSKKTHTVISWKHGDFSCGCRGWITHRTCNHCDMVASDPNHYEKKSGQVSATTGSVEGTVRLLNTKMADLEAAVRRGDPVELARIQAEVDYQRAMFEAAGEGLGERFAQVQKNIREHVYGMPESKPANKVQVQVDYIPSNHQIVNSDDPFAE